MIDTAFIRQLSARLAELEKQLSDSAAAAHQPKFRDRIREHARVRKLFEKAEAVMRLRKGVGDCREILGQADADAGMKAMAREELAKLEAALPAAEKDCLVDMLPPDPTDSRNTIMEIRAGTGGDEAALFAGDLCRMYSRYAESRGWKVGLIDASPSELGGYKEVVFSIEGEAVYRTLQYEGGIHRVQRIPMTEASGRIHTSAATVAVLPEAEDADEIEIKPEELRVDVFRASGAGGQHVNKTDSAIRLTHLATGIVVQSQDERSQGRNREKAMRVLRSRLMAFNKQREDEKTGDNRRSQIGSGDRSGRIRTYNFPQNRLTDHRINLTLYNLDRIIEGELGPVVTALHDRHVEERLKNFSMDRLFGGQGKN
ncbi:MAG: peptide chain release factor 1 [Lentisphaerae bacterium]|nr:peptide chain release factor 1 [Lentisphaerota bacterium]